MHSGAPGEDDGNQGVVPINQEHQRFPESIQKLGKRPGEDFFPHYWLKEPSSLNTDFGFQDSRAGRQHIFVALGYPTCGKAPTS